MINNETEQPTLAEVRENMPQKDCPIKWVLQRIASVFLLGILILFAGFVLFNGSVDVWMWVIISIVVILLTLNEVVADIGGEKQVEETEKWENVYLKPYIDSLPLKQTFIINRLKLSKGYAEATVVISKDGKPITLEKVKVTMDLGSGKSPILTYRVLEEDIGTITKGYYQKQISLPKDYQF